MLVVLKGLTQSTSCVTLSHMGVPGMHTVPDTFAALLARGVTVATRVGAPHTTVLRLDDSEAFRYASSACSAFASRTMDSLYISVELSSPSPLLGPGLAAAERAAWGFHRAVEGACAVLGDTVLFRAGAPLTEARRNLSSLSALSYPPCAHRDL